ncbi:MAG: DUF58 domain-containing protein [Actinomycetota bacterium]|nr:DUF58 domain-containing protein [Actinomycetota bacterium]
MSWDRLKRLGKPLFLIFLSGILYLIAANAGAGWLYVVSALMGATVIISIVTPLWNTCGIEVTRRAPVVGQAGEPLSCALEVRNKSRLGRHMLEIRDEFAGDTGRGVVARLRGRSVERIEYVVENPRRGVYYGGEVVVESGAPFGLFHGRRRIRVASSVVIQPRTFDVATLPPSASLDTERGDHSEASTLHRSHGGEFWGIREYRPGDPARLVAWRRSARGLSAGRLAVRELAQETHPPFKLAMSLDRRAPRKAREMVVSAGASLLLFALREGRMVSAYAGPQKEPFPEQPDPDAVLTWCAALAASGPPDPTRASVEVRPSIPNTGKRTGPSARPGASEAQSVVLVSCGDFAETGSRTGSRTKPWMTPDEEQRFVDEARDNGRLAVRLGPDFEEPWRIG